jgi:hypothetical protein
MDELLGRALSADDVFPIPADATDLMHPAASPFRIFTPLSGR